MLKTVKNQEERSLPFVNICFGSRDMSFQSLRNLEKKCDKKIEHYSIFKSYVIQTFLVRVDYYWHTYDLT